MKEFIIALIIIIAIHYSYRDRALDAALSYSIKIFLSGGDFPAALLIRDEQYVAIDLILRGLTRASFHGLTYVAVAAELADIFSISMMVNVP